jgi:hypothetical protein
VSEAHVAGHSTHFLRRLDRLADAHVELALVLYRDAELLKEVLSHAALPERATRVAISLDDPGEGPFVIVTRDGSYVTCLARGMFVGDLPIVTRERLDIASARVERMRERLAAARALAPGLGEAARLCAIFDRAGPILAREDFEALARWEPLLGSDFLHSAVDLELALHDTYRSILRLGKLRQKHHDAFLESWWYAFWAWAHRFVLLHVSDVRPLGDTLEERDPVLGRLALAMGPLQSGLLGPMARGLWALSRQGRTVLPALKRMRHSDPLLRIVRALGLGCVAHASKRSRAEARQAIAAPQTRLVTDAEDAVRAYCDEPLLRGLDQPHEQSVQFFERLARGILHDQLSGSGTLPAHVRGEEDLPVDVARAVIPSVWNGLFARGGYIAALACAVPWLARARAPELFLPRAWTFVFRTEYRFEVAVQLVEALRPTTGFAKQETVRKQSEPGRNDPCPCGSGKKYKRCCARA